MKKVWNWVFMNKASGLYGVTSQKYALREEASSMMESMHIKILGRISETETEVKEAQKMWGHVIRHRYNKVVSIVALGDSKESIMRADWPDWEDLGIQEFVVMI